MGDNISYQMPNQPWAVTPNPLDGYASGYKTALAIRQQNALLQAAQKYAFDPNGAVNDLIVSGNIEPGVQLLNAGLAQQRAKLFGAAANALLPASPQSAPQPVSAAPATQAAPAPQTPASAAPTAPGAAVDPNDPNAPHLTTLANASPAQQQAAHTMLDAYDSAATTLAQMPYEQRKAWIAQNTPALVQAGIPAAQIAQFDPTDQNLAAAHAQAQQVRQAVGGTPQAPLQVGGVPNSGASVPASTPGVTAPVPVSGASVPTGVPAAPEGGFSLRDPRVQQAMIALSLTGNDPSGDLTKFGSAVAPEVEYNRDGIAYDKHDPEARIIASIPKEGVQLQVQNGRVVGEGVEPGAPATIGALTGAKVGSEAAVKLPYEVAKTAADAKIAAEHDLVSVKMPDGSEIQMPRSQAIALTGHGGLGTGAGHSQTPAGATFAKGQADELNGVITADQAGRQPAQQARDDALRAVTIASQTKFNPAKPYAYQAEKIGSIFGIPSKDMDNVSAYQQISTKAILGGAKGLLPSRYTERELNLTKNMYGTIKDPNSAALMAAGVQAALANKALARANYADSYNPQSGLSRQQYEAGWASSPAGRASIYADPVFRSIKVGGQPVAIPFTARNGQHYLAVGSGLGKPTFIPAN